MTSSLPADMLNRLASSGSVDREEAWSEFLRSHSRLLMYVARSFGGDYDGTMDRYAALLDQLRRENYRRLRAFADDGRSDFTTWLVVVAQRICLDHQRARYGRQRAAVNEVTTADRNARRRLADLVGVDLDDVELPGSDSPADEMVALRERDAALLSALATLTPHDRLLLALRYRDNLAVARVAQIVGYPTRFHARRQIDKALALLRSALVERGFESASD